MKNVAADPSYAKAKQTLADRLIKTLESAGDPRVIEENPRFERPPFTNPVK